MWINIRTSGNAKHPASCSSIYIFLCTTSNIACGRAIWPYHMVVIISSRYPAGYTYMPQLVPEFLNMQPNVSAGHAKPSGCTAGNDAHCGRAAHQDGGAALAIAITTTTTTIAITIIVIATTTIIDGPADGAADQTGQVRAARREAVRGHAGVQQGPHATGGTGQHGLGHLDAAFHLSIQVGAGGRTAGDKQLDRLGHAPGAGVPRLVVVGLEGPQGVLGAPDGPHEAQLAWPDGRCRRRLARPGRSEQVSDPADGKGGADAAGYKQDLVVLAQYVGRRREVQGRGAVGQVQIQAQPRPDAVWGRRQ